VLRANKLDREDKADKEDRVDTEDKKHLKDRVEREDMRIQGGQIRQARKEAQGWRNGKIWQRGTRRTGRKRQIRRTGEVMENSA
jgi:hypothetical protein